MSVLQWTDDEIQLLLEATHHIELKGRRFNWKVKRSKYDRERKLDHNL